MSGIQVNAGSLPLVVQAGFAGSRKLVDLRVHPEVDLMVFEGEVEKWLAARLGKLRGELGLEERHFFCGISAMAIGGDMIFSRACRACGIVQRVFLPQLREAFLNARGSEEADFPLPSQKEEAVRLLEGPHVIQEKRVGEAELRAEQFDDTNREIVRVSDVLICLIRADSKGRSGGTEELAERAVQRGKPVLVIIVNVAAGKPLMTEQWRLPERNGAAVKEPARAFDPPRLPQTLAGIQLRGGREEGSVIHPYAMAVKARASLIARQMQKRFKRIALIIILAHVGATILATIALGFAPLLWRDAISILLGLELAMLAGGMAAHQLMHSTRVSHLWAEARLLAEVARSVLAIGNLHLYLAHLFLLPFPKAIRPLLRTINVLQLQSTHQDQTPWEKKRDSYIKKRLTLPAEGQIDFYGHRMDEAKARLKRFHRAFFVFWIVACLSTLLKLGVEVFMRTYIEEHAGAGEMMVGVLGTLAIVTPVLAAGALSLAMALDLEAQEHTYRDMREFLMQQERNLRNATSNREYADLVLETEFQLLGETANWFSRRSFVTVA